MDPTMCDETEEVSRLVRQAADGDQAAVETLFEQFRPRLKRMIQLRLNQRLQSRVDPSDVLQEAYLDAARRLPAYLANPTAPFFLWLRRITCHKMVDVHRQHLGAQARDANMEISLHRGPLLPASSVFLASQLLGRITSPSQGAAKAETRLIVQEALNGMDPLDREVLALRHFEQLSNSEIADELGISQEAASKRYRRALRRIQHVLIEMGAITPNDEV